MVSFFGLKLGGEKKKTKTAKDLEISGPRPLTEEEANAMDDEGLFDLESVPPTGYAASVYSLSRQNSGQSSKSKRSRFLRKGSRAATTPFNLNQSNPSLVDLPSPRQIGGSSHAALKHHASNPSMVRRWNTGSSTSLNLAPPLPLSSVARPSTSDGRKKKAWVNPLDVHYSRDSSSSAFKAPSAAPLTTLDMDATRNSSSGLSVTGASATTPRSPLGQYELKLDLPSDVSTLFADLPSFDGAVKPPEPLRIKKQPSTRHLDMSSRMPPLRKPPSPPLSLDGKAVAESPVMAPSKPLASENRLSTLRAARDEPSGLRELHSALSNFGPSDLPSPAASPRVSDDKSAAAPPAQNGGSKPVIQDVRAKRDTLTINPARRRSLQMKVEELERAAHAIPSLDERPKTSAGGGRSIGRPPPLQLGPSTRLSGADRSGPQSATFGASPRFGSPVRSSMVNSQERNTRSALGNNRGGAQSGRHSPAGSSVYDEDEYQDEVEDDHPGSPGSPVIPLTGPLASPRFPPTPSESPYPHYPHPSSFKFPRKDDAADTSDTPSFPLPPPRSAKRTPATPDSMEWPLPSPVTTTPMPPSIAAETMRLRTESNSTTQSNEFKLPPLEPPRSLGTGRSSGAESPTFRSFSRPWTPTTAESKPPLLKRAETTVANPSSLAGGNGFGGGLRPPPRSATVKAAPLSSNRLPTVTTESSSQTRISGVVGASGFDFGTGGFI